MIGAAIGAGAGLVGSIFGGNKAAKQRRKMRRYLNEQDAENTAQYNRDYYSDYTQRADAQNLMKQLRDNLSKNNKRSDNMAVVTGATPEQQAVQKEQSNKVISDTYSNIGAMGQQWKDQVSNRYLSRKQNIADQRMGIMNQNAQSHENLMSTGLNLFGGSISSLAERLWDKISAKGGKASATGGGGQMTSQLAGTGGTMFPMA